MTQRGGAAQLKKASNETRGRKKKASGSTGKDQGTLTSAVVEGEGGGEKGGGRRPLQSERKLAEKGGNR